MANNVIIRDEGYSGLNPVQFGYESCLKLHFYGPAIRTHWLIHFIESGFGIFKINGKTYRVGPGEMFVISPFTEAYYEADKENPWRYIWIGFTSDRNIPIELGEVIFCPKALGIFNAMKNSAALKNGRSAFLSARLWDLFSLLLEDEKHSTDYVDRALDCIHSEYMHDLTIGQIAARLNLDHSYFSFIFKQKIGIPPKEYLINYRMNIAVYLMLDNGNSVSVAACSVGYTDICNFSKMFKRRYGLPPAEYVKQKKGTSVNPPHI